MEKNYLNLTPELDNFDENKLHISFEYTDLDGNKIEGVYQRDNSIQELLDYFGDNLVSSSHKKSISIKPINGAIDIDKPIIIKVNPSKK